MKAVWFLFSLRGRLSRLPFCLHTAVVLAAGIALAGQAAQLYRYTNEAGQREIGTQIPPEAADRGYEIIDETGRVIRTVGPGDHVGDAPVPEPVPERAPRQRLFEDVPSEPVVDAGTLEPEPTDSATAIPPDVSMRQPVVPAPGVDVAAIAALIAAGLAAALAAWSSLACHVKRWHDRDKRGWWTLLYLFPVIGWLWSIIELVFMPGTDGPNRYGERPNAPPDPTTAPAPAWP